MEFCHLDELMDFVEQSNYAKSFVQYCSKLSLGSTQDKAFLVAIQNEFSDYGILRGFNKVCSECCRELKRKKKGSTKFDDDGEQSCDEDVVGSDDESGDDAIGESNTCERVYSLICAKKHAGMPVGTLFLGLFQGAIPDVLDGLTMVEQSMISLYSNLTRITIIMQSLLYTRLSTI